MFEAVDIFGNVILRGHYTDGMTRQNAAALFNSNHRIEKILFCGSSKMYHRNSPHILSLIAELRSSNKD